MTLAAIGIELRPSSLIEPQATSSPMKHDGDSSPLIPENYPDDDEDRDRHSSKDRDRPFSWYNFHSWCPFFGDDSRVSPYNSRISLFFFGCVHFGGFGLCLCEISIYFFPLLMPMFGCSKHVEKKWEFGFWLEF